MKRPLEIVFLTNFSDACFRVTPAIAQLVDDLDVRLTLLHLFDPERVRPEAAEIKLRSFFPEADHYGVCRRVLLEGGLDEAIAWLRRERAAGLIIAPSSDPLGLPHLARSRRARILLECGAPVWTIGRDVPPDKLRRRPRDIACWLDFESTDVTHVELALEHAAQRGARLHLLHVLPDIHEGSIRVTSTPLGVNDVIEAMSQRFGTRLARAEVHVAWNSRRAVVDLVSRCDADLLFIGQHRALVAGLLGPRVNPVVGAAPCPVICLGERSDGLRMSGRRAAEGLAMGPVAASGINVAGGE